MPEEINRTVKVLYFCSPKDECFRVKLEGFLKSLENKGKISYWSPKKILPGQKKQETIEEKLREADVILLVLSFEFFDVYPSKINKALECHNTGTAKLVPIILSSCNWQATPLGELSPLPSNGIPIEKWKYEADALFDVREGIEKVIEELSRP